MSDQVNELLREIETLRNALKGRTVSCEFCNYTEKQRDELVEAVQTFVRLNKGTHGLQWIKAMDNMCRLVNVKP